MASSASQTLPLDVALQQAFAHHQAGRLSEAEDLYQAILDAYPSQPDANHNLGILAMQVGQHAAALHYLGTALAVNPDSAEAHNSLGNALHALGQLDDAAASYRRALEIDPDYAEAHCNMGDAMKDLGQIAAALTSYRRALEIKPDFADAHNNLGNALRDLGQLDDAVACYRLALGIKPDLADAHSNLGNALRHLGQADEAVASCRRALTIRPNFAEAHNNLGNALQDLGQLDSAVASYRRALAIKPNFAEAHNNLGNTLNDLGQLDEAVASYHRALGIKPDYFEAHSNLGNALQVLGQLDDAAASHRRALEIKPDWADAYSNMLYFHAFTRDISPELECSLAANWEDIVLNEGERTDARDRALLFDDSFSHWSRAGRKLRIGVVSAEIGQHAVAEFLEPFLEQIERSRFHVTLFPTTVRRESRTTRLSKLADEFKPLVGIPDKKAADLIRADRIDILIDTTGHMRGCRLGIFAHRAAPVQCHYIGYHGTTGLTEMDWFIADEILLPSACDTHFRERIWRLPRLRLSYRGDATLPVSRWMPSLDGYVWLGSFNNVAKIREETLALWAKVMRAIPDSRLFLKDRRAIGYSVQERIRSELYRHGISGGRIEFAGHVPDWGEHMALYDKLDIALDTIPLNSETTAFDALWMGVPLVALEGNWMGGRMSSTMLRALGKPEWVAQSEDEYVAMVAALARDVEGRISLRAAQRPQMANSPLCDAKELTRSLEGAFEAMYNRWAEKRGSVGKDSMMPIG